jgi:hypothetical protein
MLHLFGMALHAYISAIGSHKENFVLLIGYILFFKKSITTLHLFRYGLTYIHIANLEPKGKLYTTNLL